jgi:hypothetical protein
MRNPLDKSSVAQSLDGNRLKGSLHVPEALCNLGVGWTQASHRPALESRLRGDLTRELGNYPGSTVIGPARHRLFQRDNLRQRFEHQYRGFLFTDCLRRDVQAIELGYEQRGA